MNLRGRSAITRAAGRTPNPTDRDDDAPSSGDDAETHDAALTAVCWAPGPRMDERRWVEYGKRLGRAGRGTSWWIGDWLRYGNARYGETYVLAARITGYDQQT
jgi:hypothetical protein